MKSHLESDIEYEIYYVNKFESTLWLEKEEVGLQNAPQKYESLSEYAVDYEQNISKNSIQLLPGTYRGELTV